MPDTAPNARVGRLIARVRVGRTGAVDPSRRYVSTNTIADGGTFEDLIDHPAVTRPLADGCLNLIVDGPDGALPEETMRYVPDNAQGEPVTTILHFDGAHRAANGNDGGAVVPWLATGKAAFAQAMTSQNRWWLIYHAKLRQATFEPTNAPPHNWPTDVSLATMNSLANWRTWYEWALANGVAGMIEDAGAVSLATDPGAYWRTILENAGTHTGASLGQPLYLAAIANGQPRLYYSEAVPRAGHWSPSFIAIRSTFEAREGNLAWMQVDDCLHPPQVWCTQEGAAEDYAAAMSYLTTRPDVLVVVNYDELYDAGLDMPALVAASLDEEEEDAGGVSGELALPTNADGCRGRRRGRGRVSMCREI